jgi:hypothetical protein
MGKNALPKADPKANPKANLKAKENPYLIIVVFSS